MSKHKDARSARTKRLNRRASMVRHTRERKLKNALRSCGKEFADRLREYYQQHPDA